MWSLERNLIVVSKCGGMDGWIKVTWDWMAVGQLPGGWMARGKVPGGGLDGLGQGASGMDGWVKVTGDWMAVEKLPWGWMAGS